MTSLKGMIAIYISLYHYWAWGVDYPADVLGRYSYQIYLLHPIFLEYFYLRRPHG